MSTVRRHRRRSVGPGRGFCFFGAAASPALWQPLRGKASCRWNCVRMPPRPRHRNDQHDQSASSGRLMLRRLGSCLVIATRRLLPGEGVGSACLRLRRLRRGGVPCPATCPGFASDRRHPRPRERCSCTAGGSQPLLAALTTLSVCLGFVPMTQAGTRQAFGAASLSASTAPASFLAGGGSRLAAGNRRSRYEKSSRRFAAALCLRPLSADDRSSSPPSPPTHPITSRYVEVVRCASTARASLARPEGLHNEC